MIKPSNNLMFCFEFMRLLQEKGRIGRTVIYVLSKKWGISHTQMEYQIRHLKGFGLISKPNEPNHDYKLGPEFTKTTVHEFCLMMEGPDYIESGIPTLTHELREKMRKMTLEEALNGIEVKL